MKSFLRKLLNRFYYLAFDESPSNVRMQYDHQCAAIDVMARELLSRPSAAEYLHVTSWQDVSGHALEDADTRDLGQLFDQFGSDKATLHNYHLIYGSILRSKRQDRIRLLEIGLGTNNLSIPSNMGISGKPGASLRAFRNWAPQADVFGADVDRGILFQEERIRTTFVDQTKIETLQNLRNEFGSDFDLIIDDGYHRPIAGFLTIIACSEMLAPGGTLVVEDIDESDLALWQLFSWMCRDRLRMILWRMRAQCVCVVNPLQ